MSHDPHDHHHHDHDHHHHDHAPKAPLEPMPLTAKGIQDHWTRSTTGGKFGIVAGSALGLGVILHGGLNIKRGLMGYDDTITGEHKKGSVENLLFGIGETYVGAATLRRFLTGNTSWALWK